MQVQCNGVCDVTCDVEALQRFALPDSTLLKQVTKCSHVDISTHQQSRSSTPFHGFCGFIFSLLVRSRVSACRRLASSLNSSKMLNVLLLTNFNCGHAVALPLRECIRSHAVGAPGDVWHARLACSVGTRKALRPHGGNDHQWILESNW